LHLSAAQASRAGGQSELPRRLCGLPTGGSSTRTVLTLRSRWSQRRTGVPRPSSPAVPLPCHSQQSRTVPSGQPRIRPKRLRPAPFSTFAADSPVQPGFASRGSIGQGLDRLAVPGRPMRSLVARGTGNAVRRPRPDGTADPEQEAANLSCAIIPHAGLSPRPDGGLPQCRGTRPSPWVKGSLWTSSV
jgi:hypothetical protein